MDYILGIAIGIFLGVIWSFVTVDSELLNKVDNTCIANKEIKEVVVEVFGITVYCNDGAKFTIEDNK